MLASAVLVVQCGWLHSQTPEPEKRLKLMAFGDVNLGRAVGQELLKGKVDYPFKMVKDSLAHADVVFANLESQLTEQKGETQHPNVQSGFLRTASGSRSPQNGQHLGRVDGKQPRI